MKSRSVSVNVTANGLAANQAQQAANQAVTAANKYKMAWDEANSETIEALNTAQKEFESNLAWAKSQIYEGQHQNDSAVASLRSNMESSWNSMSTVEESLYNSARTATSEVDSHLESLRVQNSLSLADLHSTANSLHAAADSLHGDVDTIRGSLNDTRNSLATTTSELQRQTGQLSGSLSTANSMIMFNSDAIAEVKHTAEEVSTTVSNIRVGGRNLLQGDTGREYSGTGGTQYTDIANFRMLVPVDQEHYVLSFDAKATEAGQQISTFFYCQDDYSKNCTVSAITSTGFNGATGGDGWLRTTLTTDYKRYWIKYTVNPANKVYLNAIIARIEANDGTATVSVKNAKLETGTMPTDWTPSPESIDSSISQIKQTADAIRADLTNTKGDVASVKAKADSLTSSMANAQDDISTLQHRADSITSTLSKGGVNLLTGTSSDEVANTYPTSGYADKLAYVMSVPANQTDYVLSFDAKATVAEDKIICYMYNPNQVIKAVSSQNATNTNADGSMTFNLTTDWVRYWVHYTITPTTEAAHIIVGRTTSGGGSGTVSFKCVQLEYGDTPTPWKPSNGDISSLQQTASGLTADMKDAKGNISSLQDTASQFTTRLHDAEDNVSSLQLTSKELDTQIKAVDGRASAIKETADGISARVSRIEGNNVVGSLLKLDGSEAGLGTYVNNKLIAGINTNPDGVCIEGKNIHLNGQTHIDDGVINASKITVHNSVGNADGSASDQNLAIAWGQLNSTIGGKDDQGNTLWGSINQTNSKLTSYYQELKNDGSSTRSLIQQTSKDILLAVDQKVKYKTYTVSASSPWDFNYTKLSYGNWFLIGETTADHVYNGPSYPGGQKLTLYMYVTSRGSSDGTRFTVTVWKDNDPTQYQRVWNGSSWSDWVMLPNSQNLVSAINLSPDNVKISGKNIELNGDTRVVGGFNLIPPDSTTQDQGSQNVYRPFRWQNGAMKMENGVIQITAQNVTGRFPSYGDILNNRYVIGTIAPMYIKYTLWDSPSLKREYARTYIGAEEIETPMLAVTTAGSPAQQGEPGALYVGNFEFKGSKIEAQNGSIYVTNKTGKNFDGNGSVGFQVWGGIGLGWSTIYTPDSDLYIQKGNVGPGLGARYSESGKVDVHCNRVISQRANSVSSRLSLKTDITPVSYDRALAAVEGTEMYDYRYVSDETGQHYVSGIIDDVNPEDPQYHMDDMLINKERTARIDANLVGYHHVILQELLKKIDTLEIKLKLLESKEN